MTNEKAQQVYGSSSVLKKCMGDKKFPYVVALARAVNALNSAHSLMTTTQDRDTPAALRDRMNAHFFVSGVLYESLKLIRSMTRVFSGDKSFETSLLLVLKDSSAQALEQMHLKAARHGGIFHYLPERFAEAIAKTGMSECVFASIHGGKKKGDIHYEFADYIAAEILVGTRLDDKAVVNDMMEKTLALVKQLVNHSENFIADQLNGWGFEIRPAPPSALKSQRARSSNG